MPGSRQTAMLALIALIALGTLFTVPIAHAATFTVTTFDDYPDFNPGDGVCRAQTFQLIGTPPMLMPVSLGCSLRAAIQEANASSGADTITLPAGTYTLTRTGQDEQAALTGDLDIASDITITGAGAATTIVQAGTSSDTGIDRVLDVQQSGSAKLSLTGVTVRYGSTISNGGGMLNRGTLTLTDSIFVSNTSGFGGGIANGGQATIINSTFSSNIGGNGGGISSFGNLSIIGSTISGNTAKFPGGGSSTKGDGGGIYIITGSTLRLTNSTVSGNQAEGSGGGIYADGTATLLNITVANNTADTDANGTGIGGGVTVSGASAGVNLRNTLVGDNTKGSGTSTKSDCNGTLTSQGYNLIESTDGCTVTGDTTGNITGLGPLLSDLKDNGGPTQTHALRTAVRVFVILVDSPAINAGDPGGCKAADGSALTTDQRGVARPQGARCDIGAFEFGGLAREVYIPMIVK